jgi:D-alanyl-D-alanine carboxypeptidase
LDVSAAAQSDGAGSGAYFSPDFIVQFLRHMSEQKDFQVFQDSLPILGRDGSLWNIQRDSPAAGKFYAKTGTNVTGDLLNQQYILNGKGLAGYLDVPSGDRLIMAIFLNNAHAGDSMKSVLKIGDALGEIVSAVYSAKE